MMKQRLLAKINRPLVRNIVARPRLFRLLDRRASVMWVSGPAGSGKTTLVTSWLDGRKRGCLWYDLDSADVDIPTFFHYLGLAAKKAAPRFKRPLPVLTPEHAHGIPMFTKRYFENLCSRLRPPFCMVFDNYHHLPPDSPFHNVMREALTVIPSGITVIIVSRSAPPSSLSDLLLKGKFVDWEALRFTEDESRRMLRMHNRTVSENLLRSLHETTQGWAAGIIMMAQGQVGKTDNRRLRRRTSSGKSFCLFCRGGLGSV